MISVRSSVAVLATAFLLAACGSSDDPPTTGTNTSGSPTSVVGTDGTPPTGNTPSDPAPTEPVPVTKNAVEVAQSVPDLSILVEAVVAADLAGTLSAPGTFTIFAPTNAAFADLLAELNVSKADLLANKDLLTQVLTYHVLGVEVPKASVPIDTPITTLQGETFTIGADLAITDARGRKSNIVTTDVAATNAVIHVIDKVILPAPPAAAEPKPSIVAIAQSVPDFSLLVEAVIAADLVDALSGPGPLTVFAPDNKAFEALLHELHLTKDALFADKALLTQVLTYHVVSGAVRKADVPVGQPITTLQGDTFTVNAELVITDARHRHASIVATDIEAENGVIHRIDRVILPH